MEKEALLTKILDSKIIGIIRVDDSRRLLDIVKALYEGGLTCLEITMNTPGALRGIEEIAEKLPEVLIGAGTILDGPTARNAVLVGAKFLVTPTIEPDVLEIAHRYGIPAILGAMTPTEILTAWELGSDLVKVFPANILGPKFIQEIRGPLPQIPLVPTGGITADNAGEFIKAGAVAVCVGSWLVDRKAIAEGRYAVLTEKASKLIQAIRNAMEVM